MSNDERSDGRRVGELAARPGSPCGHCTTNGEIGLLEATTRTAAPIASTPTPTSNVCIASACCADSACPSARSPPTDDLLEVLEEMTMLDSTVQRRISILVYSDLQAAFDFLERVFGLGPGELTRDRDGNLVHGEIQAGDGVVWLHPEAAEFGLFSPRSLGGASASMAVMVDDVDAHYRHALEQGAQIDYEPVDQPYGFREYSARDSEGGLWSFMKPLD
jgi:uncharacterized glyoxalase superfamily protein PhnB